MFERFSDNARKSMALANTAAHQLGHECLGPNHVLLGLLNGDGSTATAMLAELGVNLHELKTRARSLDAPSGPETTGRLAQTLAAKKVIEFAIAEARDIG